MTTKQTKTACPLPVFYHFLKFLFDVNGPSYLRQSNIPSSEFLGVAAGTCSKLREAADHPSPPPIQLKTVLSVCRKLHIHPVDCPGLSHLVSEIEDFANDVSRPLDHSSDTIQDWLKRFHAAVTTGEDLRDFPWIWSGFQGKFRAYNAPFVLEDSSNQHTRQRQIQFHRERMREETFQESIYLYVLDDESAKKRQRIGNAIHLLIRFYADVCDEGIGLANIDQKLRVRVCRGEYVARTFFTGSKFGMPFSIVYEPNPDFRRSNVPSAYSVQKEDAVSAELIHEFDVAAEAGSLDFRMSSFCSAFGASFQIPTLGRVQTILDQAYEMLESSHVDGTFAQTVISPTLQANEETNAEESVVEHKFGFGQSPFSPPRSMMDALSRSSFQRSSCRYPEVQGESGLIHAIADHWSNTFGCSKSFNVIVGPGSKSLLHAVQRVVKGPIMLPVPSWVSYAPQSLFVQSERVWVKTDFGNGFFPTYDQLKSAYLSHHLSARPSKLLINSPNNPTGQVASPSIRDEIVRFCRDYQVLLLSDEIYADFVFDSQHHSFIAEMPENTVVFSGLSKSHGVGGWRFGFALIPKQLSRLNQSLKVYASDTWSGVSVPVQEAAKDAYTNYDLTRSGAQSCVQHAMLKYVYRGIKQFCATLEPPQGAFYLYPTIDNSCRLSSTELSEQLLKAGISALPGTAFGDQENTAVRLCVVDFPGDKLTNQVLTSGPPGDEFKSFVEQECPAIVKATEALANEFLTATCQ